MAAVIQLGARWDRSDQQFVHNPVGKLARSAPPDQGVSVAARFLPLPASGLDNRVLVDQALADVSVDAHNRLGVTPLAPPLIVLIAPAESVVGPAAPPDAARTLGHVDSLKSASPRVFAHRGGTFVSVLTLPGPRSPGKEPGISSGVSSARRCAPAT